MHIDLQFGMLERMLASLDVMIAELERDAAHSDDPDSMGIYDAIESITGLGFVACQNYLTARRRDRHPKHAYACGPLHSSGQHIASVINAAANYWKHHPEWPYDEKEYGKLQLASVEILRQVGVWKGDYKTANLLHALVGDTRFQLLLMHLDAWREALDPGGFIP